MNYTEIVTETWRHGRLGASPHDFKELIRYATLGCATENLLLAARAAGLKGHCRFDASASGLVNSKPGFGSGNRDRSIFDGFNGIELAIGINWMFMRHPDNKRSDRPYYAFG